jgi:hypothetical protein
MPLYNDGRLTVIRAVVKKSAHRRQRGESPATEANGGWQGKQLGTGAGYRRLSIEAQTLRVRRELMLNYGFSQRNQPRLVDLERDRQKIVGRHESQDYALIVGTSLRSS